jgi:hypothetical protein
MYKLKSKALNGRVPEISNELAGKHYSLVSWDDPRE